MAMKEKWEMKEQKNVEMDANQVQIQVVHPVVLAGGEATAIIAIMSKS